MRVTPAAAWSVSLGVCGLLWVLLPLLRPAMTVILAAHAPVLAWGIFDIRSRFFGPVLVRGPRRGRTVALTFDDGPDPAVTPEVLGLLAESGCTATFFVVGERALRHPELVHAMAAAGHTVGCHTMRHSVWNNFRLGSAMRREIAAAQEAVQSVLGHAPLLYRPSSGLMNPHVLPALRALGMTCVGWSRRAGDAGNRRPGAVRRIASLAGPGEVVLLHDTAPDQQRREIFIAALRQLLAEVRRRGLEGVTVDRLFGVAAYRQPAAATR